MKAPTTYLEWTLLLDKFGDGDDNTLEELSKGNFTIDAGTASRFYKRVEEVYKKRKQNWLDRFQNSLQIYNFKSEDEFEILLRNGKKNLSPLIKFVVLKGLPFDLKKILKKDLEDFVDEIKKSLNDNISTHSSEKEKTLILLNSFGIFDFPEENKPDKKNNTNNLKEIFPTTRRKIIF